jgi:hypothetical protein
MNSDMWRSLCDEIPSEATPYELDAALRQAEAGGLSEDERAALRTTLTSPRQRNSAHVREVRERAPVAPHDQSPD